MKGFKEPGFQDRAAASARAKQSALEKLKAAPKRDPAAIAARAARQRPPQRPLDRRQGSTGRSELAAGDHDRRAGRRWREEKEAARRAAARAAKEAAQAEKEAQAAREAEAAARAAPPVRTEAELKAARDARYAARKKRKS